MLLVIDVTPEVEEGFRQAAAGRGPTPDEFAKALVEREARAVANRSDTQGTGLTLTPAALTPEEKATAFLDWAAAHRTDIPMVPLEAMSRDNLFADRGL